MPREELTVHVEVIVFDFDIYYVRFLALLSRGAIRKSRLPLLHSSGALKLALSRILNDILDLHDAFAGAEGLVPDLLAVKRRCVHAGDLLLLERLAGLPREVLRLVVVFVCGVGAKHPVDCICNYNYLINSKSI